VAASRDQGTSARLLAATGSKLPGNFLCCAW
jgi:hypothetical protein